MVYGRRVNEWITTIYDRGLWIIALVRPLLQALRGLRHLMWRWTLLWLLLWILRWWHEARIALTWRIGHNASEEVAGPMSNRRRCRLGDSAVRRQATQTYMRRWTTSSLDLVA